MRSPLPAALLATVLLAACGPDVGYGSTYSYDLDRPLQFTLTPTLSAELGEEGRGVFERAAAQTARNLGTTLGETTNRTVEWTVGDCDDGDGAVANGATVTLCRGGYDLLYRLLLALVMHETGHVMGAGHVPCDGASFMASDHFLSSCRTRAPDPEDEVYSPADLAAICAHARGGVCRGR